MDNVPSKVRQDFLHRQLIWLSPLVVTISWSFSEFKVCRVIRYSLLHPNNRRSGPLWTVLKWLGMNCRLFHSSTWRYDLALILNFIDAISVWYRVLLLGQSLHNYLVWGYQHLLLLLLSELGQSLFGRVDRLSGFFKLRLFIIVIASPDEVIVC